MKLGLRRREGHCRLRDLPLSRPAAFNLDQQDLCAWAANQNALAKLAACFLTGTHIRHRRLVGVVRCRILGRKYWGGGVPSDRLAFQSAGFNILKSSAQIVQPAGLLTRRRGGLSMLPFAHSVKYPSKPA